MGDTWSERYVDDHVDRAWLALRVELAERFATGVAEGGMAPIDISAPGGDSLSVWIDDDHEVVVVAGDEVTGSANVDEAAFRVSQILRERFEVLHPVFLASDLLGLPPAPPAAPTPAQAPVLGYAESGEQLQGWVEAAFQSRMAMPLRVDSDHDIRWRSTGGNRVTVRVLNRGRIEIFATLAEGVGRKKAHRIIDKLARRYFGLKFMLVADRIVVSQVVLAWPFVPEQLHDALNVFFRDVDDLDWVSDRAQRSRADEQGEVA